MDFKSCKSKLEVDEGERIIEGYASIFDNVDLGGDMVVRGAFEKTIAERGPAGQNLIKVFWWHQDPIGYPLDIREDEKGLWTRARISKTPRGDEALTLARDGVAAHMSFAYDVVGEPEIDEKDGQEIRILRELKLYEFGPVIWPMNEAAVVTAAKAKYGVPPKVEDGRELVWIDGERLRKLETEIADLHKQARRIGSLYRDGDDGTRRTMKARR